MHFSSRVTPINASPLNTSWFFIWQCLFLLQLKALSAYTVNIFNFLLEFDCGCSVQAFFQNELFRAVVVIDY